MLGLMLRSRLLKGLPLLEEFSTQNVHPAFSAVRFP
jgi:hypothetical protein